MHSQAVKKCLAYSETGNRPSLVVALLSLFDVHTGNYLKNNKDISYKDILNINDLHLCDLIGSRVCPMSLFDAFLRNAAVQAGNNAPSEITRYTFARGRAQSSSGSDQPPSGSSSCSAFSMTPFDVHCSVLAPKIFHEFRPNTKNHM